MTKNILVPVDFTIESLNIVKRILNESDGTFNVILLHGLRMSTSITDLLFFSKEKTLSELYNPEFEEAIHILKNKFDSKILSIKTDLFSGYNKAAFENYIRAHSLDEIVVPKNYRFNFPNKKSFDWVPFAYKVNIKLTEVFVHQETLLPEKGKLAEIFYDQMAIGQ